MAMEKLTHMGSSRHQTREDGTAAGAPIAPVHKEAEPPISDQCPLPGSGHMSTASIKSGLIGMINRDQNDPAYLGSAAASPVLSSGTERSFPLTGGVTSHGPTDRTTDSRVHHSHGRESLAGAAAAAVASSAVPGHRHEPANNTTKSTVSGQSNQGPHPDALTAARAAASKTPSVPSIGQTNTASGISTQSEGGIEGLLYTQGPHHTDIANMTDPKLHIPGAFPSPTPINEPPEPSYISSKPTDGIQHELRHTGTLEDPLTKSADPASKDHHHGRDAAIAGGFGAAGAAAYAAGKHHEEAQKSDNGEVFPEEKSPYSSTSIDPRVDATPKLSQQRYDPLSTNKPQARDPLLTSTTSSQPHDKSQHGHDAALTGAGAGAATTAALYASQRAHEPDSTGPASSTIGPHKSNVANVLDPRVHPDPNLQKHHQAGSTVDDPASSTVGPHKSNIANIVDPRVLPDPQKQKAAPKEEKEHHNGRDAAIVAGAGAAGYGAYEAAKAYGDHKSTGPAASMEEQRFDPSIASDTRAPFPGAAAQGGQGLQHHHGRDAAVLGGAGAAGSGAAGAYAATGGNEHSQPQQDGLAQRQHSPTTTGQQQHHYGRDAAVVGGLGAAGAGAYAATRGNDHTSQQAHKPSQTQQQHSPLSPVHRTSAGAGTGAAHQRYDSVQLDPHSPKSQQHHQKRDVAALEATGAAADAGGAYAYSQHEREAAQKAHEQQLKDEEKLFRARQKEQEKALHDREKEQHGLEKKHSKRLSKEVDKEEKGKHHGVFGFLHRDKDKKRNGSEESSTRASTEDARHDKEYAVAGVGAAAAAHESGRTSGRTEEEEREGRNRLHKDPPKGHPVREAMELAQHPQGHAKTGAGAGAGADSRIATGQREHIGTDGSIGIPDKISGDRQTTAGGHGAHSSDNAHRTVIEPHTGLPMNVERYGNGHGGTDANAAIEGYRAHAHHGAGTHNAAAGAEHAGTGARTTEVSVTDWEAIKKANTLY